MRVRKFPLLRYTRTIRLCTFLIALAAVSDDLVSTLLCELRVSRVRQGGSVVIHAS